jgi:hypothetical protein
MEDPNWKKCLIQADSKQILRKIPDQSVDFIFTDPPYNIGRHSTGNIPLPGRAPMNNDVADWDWVDFYPEEWADELVRVLKPTGNLFIFTSYNQLGKWYECLDHRFDTSNFMVWHKTNPAPKIFKAGFLNSCEMIFTCWNKRHTWNFISQKEMHNFIESPICMRPERLSCPKHPAQKPVSILKKIIEIATNANDIVLDPFMGVGSIGVAALALGRRYIGIEINNEYFKAAKKRVESMLTPMYEETDWACENPKSNETNGYVNSDSLPFEYGNKANDTQPDVVNRHLQPLLKWAGGKERELQYILPNLPTFERYFEPFVGGGSVFTAVHAKRYFVNDLSQELTDIYQYIATQDELFFKYANAIVETWDMAKDFFLQNSNLLSLYQDYQHKVLSRNNLEQAITVFCTDKGKEIAAMLGKYLQCAQKVLQTEIKKNLLRKMLRMRKLEEERGELPVKDIEDNLETAIKSALYMALRHLYNDKSITSGNRELHGALFLFIRNYAYSGMFRYNARGDFNVPYGGIGYNSKSMRKKLDYYLSASLHNLFTQTTIFNQDFEVFLKRNTPSKNDFIFLDPPYDSEFSTYAQNEFTQSDQQRLANYLLNECQAKWMLVIKNTDFIFSLYNKDGVHIRSFEKSYAVSFMNRNDKRTTHLLITNYC